MRTPLSAPHARQPQEVGAAEKVIAMASEALHKAVDQMIPDSDSSVTQIDAAAALSNAAAKMMLKDPAPGQHTRSRASFTRTPPLALLRTAARSPVIRSSIRNYRSALSAETRREHIPPLCAPTLWKPRVSLCGLAPAH
eukprot:4572861-Prymnesium_polylepis.1